MTTSAMRAPLQMALEQYTHVMAGSRLAKPLLSEREKTAFDQAFHKEQQGLLTPKQQTRLMHAVNKVFKEVINPLFNRSFSIGISSMTCVDIMGQTNGAYVLYERAEKPAMFGGFVNKGESCQKAAIRELHEETGRGCRLTTIGRPTVRDYAIKDNDNAYNSPRISLIYRGAIEGTPRANKEAKRFYYFPEETIMSFQEKTCFHKHAPMMQSAIKHPSQNDRYHMMSHETKPLSEEKKAAIRERVNRMSRLTPSPVVDQTINKIETIMNKTIQDLTALEKKIKSTMPDFDSSKDLLWPKNEAEKTEAQIAYEEKCDWDDFNRLWDLLSPWQGRLFSNKLKEAPFSINSLFNTCINMRESGELELVALIKNKEGKFLLEKSEQGLRFPSIIPRYNETFPEALYRGIYDQLSAEVKDGCILREIGDQIESKFEQDEYGNDLRRFFLEAELDESNFSSSAFTFLSKTELFQPIRKENWNKRHAEYAFKLLF